MFPLAIYIHWPFCKAKCPYCDFNSHVTDSIDARRWQRAYLREMEYFAERVGRRVVRSIFFGGGTPSLMPVSLVEAILKKIQERFDIAADCEITLEMNPTSVEAEKLAGFKAAGVNRVSMGIQSLRAESLKFLGRQHSAEEALAALGVVRALFDNYSFDLIYARPGQSVQAWQAELAQALEYAGPHFSLYQLTIEKGTPFYAAHQRGEFQLPPEEDAAEMYELTERALAEKGLLAYEVSNYAKPGKECRHNLQYWHYGEYLGIGPGAHGRIGSLRHATMMLHAPEQWLKAVEAKGQGLQTDQLLSAEDVFEEALMMGLRLVEGIDAACFQAVTGQELFTKLTQEKIRKLEGLLIADGQSLRATPRGRLLLSSLTSALLA